MAAKASGALNGLGRGGHCTGEAPEVSAVPTVSVRSLGVAKAVPAPAMVTAAAVAAVATHREGVIEASPAAAGSDTPAPRHAGICIEHRSMQQMELHQGVEVAVRAGPQEAAS
jgi:hypothetical protein